MEKTKEVKLTAYDKPLPKLRVIPFSNGGAIGISLGKMMYTVISSGEIHDIKKYNDWAFFINLWSHTLTLVILRYSQPYERF